MLLLDDSHQRFLELYETPLNNYFKSKRSLVQTLSHYVTGSESGSQNQPLDPKRDNSINYWWSQAQLRILIHYGKVFIFFTNYKLRLSLRYFLLTQGKWLSPSRLAILLILKWQ